MLTRRTTLLGLSAVALAPLAFAQETDVLAAAMEGKAVPGMAALVIRNYRAEREMVAGVRKLGDPDPVRRGDRWHLGSDGKAMTATLVARLVERGVLAWDRPLSEMLPGVEMHADYRDVTLPDLLSHRSGLPENADLDFFNTFYADTAPLPDQRLRYVTRALQDAPVTPKRGERSYSNTGFLIAGAIAERAAGTPYEHLMLTHVFRPLRMRSVSFLQHGGAGEPCGHVDGRVADRERDPNPPMFAPCGGMRMSLRDWSRFCIDHLSGERERGRLLRQETYRFIHTPQGETTAALGWGRQERMAGRIGPVLVHAGSDGNWYALVALFPETGNGVLVAANAAESMGGDAASLAALRALAATVSRQAAQ